MNVDDVKALHAHMEQARRRYIATTAALHHGVTQALDNDVRAVEIAEACDVTRSRVYQWARAAERKD